MGTVQNDSIVKNVLKNLCCIYGWSYGAFWSYDQPNSLLLTLKDAYFEEEFEGLIDNLLLQVPTGGGLIGQAAYTNKHLWMSSEDHYREHKFSGSIWDMFMDDYEFRRQFTSSMKTIAVIPVEPQGVVQFGSNQKILERTEFVNQTKRMFQETVNGGSDQFSSCSLNSQISHQNQTFGSFLSSEDLNLVFDSLPDFGIPDEFFRTGDFNVSQWFPPPKDDLIGFNFNPFDSDENHESLTDSGTGVDQLGINGGLGDILRPIRGGTHTGFHSYSSECTKPKPKPSQYVDSTSLGPKERLFSKLGIEELLEGISGISNATSTGEVASKRRKMGNYALQKEVMSKPEPSLRVVDCYSGSGSSTVLQVEPPKATKKKAKPGTRPRPKDRQQILDRMAELRKLIPNGEKVSIDCLLDRTIKHMVFLESITKQADKIKQAEEQKARKVDSNDQSTNGLTWACELGNQTLVCPLIVEDLDASSQMLIEMLCEEQGFFLEIMDVIRRFGLVILKGVMEARNDKIYAHFIVEPEVNKHITRHEIFKALVQFLQTMQPSDDKTYTKSGNSLPDDFYQQEIQSLMNLTDMQYCVNL